MTAQVAIAVENTVTTLGAHCRGAVLVTGSHGGLIAGHLAWQAGVRAVIFNDAGVGLDDAGIASLEVLQAAGIAAATVDVHSARIGDAADSLDRGVISHANAAAAALGVMSGQSCAQAATALKAAPLRPAGNAHAETRQRLAVFGRREVWGLDSASLAQPQDIGRILVIGSHGGLPGGDPAKALKTDAFAAVFNDAGVGMDGAGITRLPALQSRGIAAATLDANTARIGDALSAWNTGIVSHVNRAAEALGGRPGQACAAFVETLAEAGA